MNTRLLTAILALIAIPTIAAAAPSRPGPYVSGFLGVSVANDADVSTTDATGTPTLQYSDRVEFDPGVFFGASGGYDFGMLRLEGELSYRYAEMKNITDRDTGFRYRDIDGNLGVLAVLGNAYIDLHNQSPITPYLGSGIGFATLHLGNTFARDAAGRVRLYRQGDDTVLAYQLGAGLGIALNPRVTLDVGYRYFGTSKATFDKDWDFASDLEFASHNVLVGARVKF